MRRPYHERAAAGADPQFAMTTLLALETATAACSVAVLRDGIERHLFELAERAHAERLLPMVGQAMAEAGVDFVRLDAIGVSIGPGSFTSLRIGLAAARGLALAVDKPCFGITSLETIADAACPAAQDRGCSHVLVALDSRRRDLFVQAFAADGPPLTTPSIIAIDGLVAYVNGLGGGRPGAVALAGDAAGAIAAPLGAAGVPHRVLTDCLYPTALSVARLTLRRWRAGERPQAPPRPLYLRAADTGPPIAPPPIVHPSG